MRSSNIPMFIVTQLAWMAFQIGIACAATFGAEQVISWLGFDASYTDRPQFLKWLGFFFGIPALIGVMGTIMGMQIELDAMREADDGLQAGNVDAVSFEPFDDFDAISPPRNGGTRLIDDGRRRDGL
jgi:hypothetical protein